MLTSCAITADIKPNSFAVLSCAVLLFLAANATAASRLACRLPCAKDVLQLSFLKASSYIAILKGIQQADAFSNIHANAVNCAA